MADWATTAEFVTHVASVGVTGTTPIDTAEVQQQLDLIEAEVKAWMTKPSPPWSLTQTDTVAQNYLKGIVLQGTYAWFLRRPGAPSRKRGRHDQDGAQAEQRGYERKLCTLAGINPKGGGKCKPILPGGVVEAEPAAIDATSGRIRSISLAGCQPVDPINNQGARSNDWASSYYRRRDDENCSETTF